ncbi:MAG TPA: FmdB family zinc ribbon protein [Chthonomonadaceae bacterium]|nr:FmdB family zinc ribbon protein [Chthonomonadaceae bacterium]
MPTYGYRCEKCGHQFQVFQKMSDAPVSTCPECRGKVKRLLYPVGIVFKGSGWHITDYRKPEKSEKAEEAATTSDSGSAKPDAAKKESTGTESTSKPEAASTAGKTGE